WIEHTVLYNLNSHFKLQPSALLLDIIALHCLVSPWIQLIIESSLATEGEVIEIEVW
ncbi:hypothetical protein NECAME_02717, partial [Necator americanus]